MPAVKGDEGDDALAAAAASGDRDALDALLRRHAGLVNAVCRRVLANPDDALDATQEALLAIARKIHTFDGGRVSRLGATASPPTPRSTKPGAAPGVHRRSTSSPSLAAEARRSTTSSPTSSTSTPRSPNSRPITAPRSRCAISSASTTPRSARCSASRREPCDPASPAAGRASPITSRTATQGTKRVVRNIQRREHHEHRTRTPQPRCRRRAVERGARRRARRRRPRARSQRIGSDRTQLGATPGVDARRVALRPRATCIAARPSARGLSVEDRLVAAAMARDDLARCAARGRLERQWRVLVAAGSVAAAIAVIVGVSSMNNDASSTKSSMASTHRRRRSAASTRPAPHNSAGRNRPDFGDVTKGRIALRPPDGSVENSRPRRTGPDRGDREVGRSEPPGRRRRRFRGGVPVGLSLVRAAPPACRSAERLHDVDRPP